MTARRLALLLDIGFGTLQGSASSATRMQGCLERRGFTTKTLRGPEVTRANIKSELERVRLGEGDSFVLYFVGHGERASGERFAATGERPAPGTDVLFLVTHDVFDPAGDAPPGVAGVELMQWIEPIADETRNVTVILDCCRAATLTAGAGAVDDAARARIAATVTRAGDTIRRKHGIGVTRGDSPHIVRLVATGASDVAVERELADGTGRIGLFTDALVQVLDATAHERSWDELLPELQDIVRADWPDQRPGVEGPRHRVPFSHHERPPLGAYLFRPDRGGAEGELLAGALHGVEAGDRFSLGPVDATAIEVGLDRAVVRLDHAAGLPDPTRAQRVASASRHRILCPDSQVLPDMLQNALQAAPELEIVTGPVAVAHTLDHAGAHVLLRDRHGAIVHAEQAPGTALGAGRLVDAARRLVRWDQQRGVLATLPDPFVHAAWGRVGDERELPVAGAELRVGERVWIRAWGTGEHPEVYTSLFHLHGDRRLVHLTDSLDHGVSVKRNSSIAIAPEPISLTWPTDVPRAAPCEQVLVVLTSLRPRAFHRVSTGPHEPAAQLSRRRSEREAPDIGALLFSYRLLP